MNSNFVFLLVVAAFVLSCKTSKRIVDTDLKDYSAEALMKKVESNQIDADWLGARLKVNYKGDDMSVSFNCQLRMKKDSVIWLSAKKFGFEIARVLITPDSIFTMDRMNGTTQAESLEGIVKMVNFPADFAMIQSVLLGNPVFFTRKLQTEKTGSEYRLWSDLASPASDYKLNGDFLVTRMEFKESRPERQVLMLLDGYSTLPGQQKQFSHVRKLNMVSNENGRTESQEVEIEFSSIELNSPLKMPFK